MRCFLLFFLIVLGFATSAAAVPWPEGRWNLRVRVSADPALIEGSETFQDFALLVNLDGTNHAGIFASAKPDGSDLYLTEVDGTTELQREIVNFDPVAEKAEIWVRLASFSGTQNEFYLYYDHPDTALDPSPVGAWGSEYRAVYHFADNPGNGILSDSSPQFADAALTPESSWTSSDVDSAQIGQGWNFNGTTHHIATNSISTADSSYAISAWLLNTQANTDFFLQAQPDFWALATQTTGTNPAYFGQHSVTWYPWPIPLNQGYRHFLWAFDAVADTIVFYYDGVPQQIRTLFPQDNNPIYEGRLINPTKSSPVSIVGPMFATTVQDFHSGGADEFRIREGVMSPERVLTEYRTQADNQAFLLFGNEEARDGTPVGIADAGTLLYLRSFPNPSSGRSRVEYALPAEGPVRLSVYDLAGRRVAVLVDRRMPAGRWSNTWNGRGGDGSTLAAGVYFLRLSTPVGERSIKVTLVR